MKTFELSTRTFAKRSKAQVIKLLGEQDIKPFPYKFVKHKDLKQYSVFAGSEKVAVVQEGTKPFTKAVLELVNLAVPEGLEKVVSQHPQATDWSTFDQGQMWEVYQGLSAGVDVAAFFNPQISATEMCAMRLAAQ